MSRAGRLRKRVSLSGLLALAHSTGDVPSTFDSYRLVGELVRHRLSTWSRSAGSGLFANSVVRRVGE